MSLLLRDPRFQLVTLGTKRRILELIGATAAFGTQTFDLVMTPAPAPPITPDDVDEHFPTLTLVEMKTTKGAIADQALRGFFFGATEREYAMAKALGPRYCLLSSAERHQCVQSDRSPYSSISRSRGAASPASCSVPGELQDRHRGGGDVSEHVIVFGEHGDIPLGSPTEPPLA